MLTEEKKTLLKKKEAQREDLHNKIASYINKELDTLLYPRDLVISAPTFLVSSGMSGLGLLPSVLLPMLTVPEKAPALMLGVLAAFPIWMLATQTSYDVFIRLLKYPADALTLGLTRRRGKHVNHSLPYTDEIDAALLTYIQGIGSACVTYYTGKVLLNRVNRILPMSQEFRLVAAVANGLSGLITNTTFIDSRHQAELNELAAKMAGLEDYTLRFWQDQQLILLQEELMTNRSRKNDISLGEILADFIEDYVNLPLDIIEASEHAKLMWRIYQLEKLSGRIVPLQLRQVSQRQAHAAPRRWVVGKWLMNQLVVAACVNYLAAGIDAADDKENSPFFVDIPSVANLLAIYFALSSFRANTNINTQMNSELMNFFRLLGLPQGILTGPWQELSTPKRIVEVTGIGFAAIAAALIGFLSYQFPLISIQPWPFMQGMITGVGSFPLALRPIIKGFNSLLLTGYNWYYGWSKNYSNMRSVYAAANNQQKKVLTNYLTHTILEMIQEVRRQTQRTPTETVKQDLTWRITFQAIGRIASNRYGLFANNLDKRLYEKVLNFIDEENFNAALGKIEEFLDSKPYDAEGWYTRGFILFKLNDYETAISSFNESLKLDRHKPEAYFYLGQIYEASEENEKAEENYKLCLEFDPQNLAARDSLERFKRREDKKEEGELTFQG